MKGYCAKCREYRSDEGDNAWGFTWVNGVPRCGKCGSFVDVFDDEIYPDDGKPKKFPEITRGQCDKCD